MKPMPKTPSLNPPSQPRTYPLLHQKQNCCSYRSMNFTLTQPQKPIPQLALLALLASFCIALAAPSLAQTAQTAQSQTPTSAPPPPAVKEKTALDLFNAGGPLMYPLLLCSIGTVAVAVYCFIQINPSKMLPKTQVEAMGQYMQQRDAANAYQLCQAQPSVFANTMAAALLKVNFERDLANKVSMEQAAAETLSNEETRLMQWVNYLNVFATIGPMLGLLGTVTGMIQSFDQLAAGRSEPQDLAGGIGEAMITTASGLIVGIPAMFFYFYFRNKLTMTISNIQKRVTFMIDILSGELKLEGATAEFSHAHPTGQGAPTDASPA
ncbi:MAG: MotA/TolQ/ExbB proton channel family protein [Chthoniobacterales bacterium]|nr:MotA/TolQ/ExbB proton channel family protein [Chthoniobacterales bacterium]